MRKGLLMWRFTALTFLGLLAVSGEASAACSSYPYNLANGTTADATQVMANFACAALTSGSTLAGTTMSGVTTFPGSTTFDASGNLTIGKAVASSGLIGLTLDTDGSYSFTADMANGHYSIVNSPTGAGTYVQFRNNGSIVGSIAIGGASTAFNTTSDRRLKRDIRDTDASHMDTLFNKLRVRDWTWKKDGQEGTGFIAQELYEVIPGAVTKGDDNSTGHPNEPGFRPWYVDYSKVTPYVVGEVQFLRRRLDNSEAVQARQERQIADLQAQIAERRASRLITKRPGGPLDTVREISAVTRAQSVQIHDLKVEVDTLKRMVEVRTARR